MKAIIAIFYATLLALFIILSWFYCVN